MRFETHQRLRCVSAREQPKEVQNHLFKHPTVKHIATLGSYSTLYDAKEVQILNLAEVTVHQSPPLRSVCTVEDKPNPLLITAQHSASQTMPCIGPQRLFCVTSHFSTRWMQSPTIGDFEALQRVARYLPGHGLLVQTFVRQIEGQSYFLGFHRLTSRARQLDLVQYDQGFQTRRDSF